MADRGHLHHVEIWVADFETAEPSWGWLLGELGYRPFHAWTNGKSWKLGATYIVVEQSSDTRDLAHDRLAPGLNHLAFHGGSQADVDRLVDACTEHGWSLLFADRHPYAGGPDHYAAYLENVDGFEVELCAAT
ncbi:MAG: VOC family protein [Actinomycetota bacterium]